QGRADEMQPAAGSVRVLAEIDRIEVFEARIAPRVRGSIAHGGLSHEPASVPIPKFATTLRHAPRRTPESKDTSKSMILVPLLNPKFATHPAAMLGELRVRGTSILDPFAGPRN